MAEQDSTAPIAAEEETEEALEALAARLGTACLARGATIATAESCTGGLISHAITQVSGASGYLRGGIVAYGDEVKTALLGVPHTTLAEHGAVSAQVALAMAQGARARFGVDLAVAVTGIAGPTGGTPAKPVGLTYVAVADATGSAVRRHRWRGDRQANKAASARAALTMLLERLGDAGR